MFEVRRGTRYFNKQVRYSESQAFCGQHIRLSPNEAYYLFSGESKVKCAEGDKFNKDFGLELASVNAEIAMLKDYKKALISLTKQPEWRKEKKREDEIELRLTDYVRIPVRNGLYTLSPGTKIYVLKE